MASRLALPTVRPWSRSAFLARARRNRRSSSNTFSMPRKTYRKPARFMSSINVLGLPAAVVPIGLVAGNAVGVQLIGSRYREDVCLDAAAAIEAKVGIMAKRLWERI